MTAHPAPAEVPLCGSVKPESGVTCTVPIHHPVHGHYAKPVGWWHASEAEFAAWAHVDPEFEAQRVKAKACPAPDSRVEKLAKVLRCNAIYAKDQVRRIESAGLLVLDPKSDELVERIAEALARDANAEFIRISGHGTPWDELAPERRHRAIVSLTGAALAVVSALATPRTESAFPAGWLQGQLQKCEEAFSTLPEHVRRSFIERRIDRTTDYSNE